MLLTMKHLTGELRNFVEFFSGGESVYIADRNAMKVMQALLNEDTYLAIQRPLF